MLTRLLARFAPAPAQPEIQDPELVAQRYRYWRTRILYSVYLGYVVFYLTRKSYTFAMPHLMDELNLSKNTIVWFLSDNGGMKRTSDNRPLKGAKGSPFEGGLRVPCLT